MAWLLVGLLLTGCAADVEVGSARAAITNGAADTSDPAVVMIVGAMAEVLCSGVVIGPHSVLTAAHCLADPLAIDQVGVVLPPDASGGGGFDLSDALVHPQFDATTFDHDLALLTIRQRLPVAPLAIDTRTVDMTLVGQSFTIVGFGSTLAGATDVGTRRKGTSQVTAVDALSFTAAAMPSQPCSGDSGGPALFTSGEVTAIASHGDSGCSDHAVFARLDVSKADFIDPYLQSLDVGPFDAGERCLFDEQCKSGSCLVAADDPRRAFCSQPCTTDQDCPQPLICAPDGCRYQSASPGTLGTACTQASECADGFCESGVCTRPCVPTGSDCPSGFSCANTNGDIDFFCRKNPVVVSSGCDVGGRTRTMPWAFLLLITALWARGSIRAERRSSS